MILRIYCRAAQRRIMSDSEFYPKFAVASVDGDDDTISDNVVVRTFAVHTYM